MQQSFVQPRDDRAAYEYTVQATEDRHEGPAEDAPGGRESTVWRSESAPDYKPKPLRWPFISTVMVMLLVAIALVVVAEKQLPDSDFSATILGLHPNASQPEGLRFVRAAQEDAFTNTSAEATVDAASGGPAPPSALTTLVVTTATTQTQGSSATSEEANHPSQSSTAADPQHLTTQLASVPVASTSTPTSNPAESSTVTTTSPVVASPTTTSPVSTSSPSTPSPDPVKPSMSTTGLPSSPVSSTSSTVKSSTVTTSTISSSETGDSASIGLIDIVPGSVTITSTASGSISLASAASTASLPSGARVTTIVSVSRATDSITSTSTSLTTYTVSSDETTSFTTNTTYTTTRTTTVSDPTETPSSPFPTSQYATSASGNATEPTSITEQVPVIVTLTETVTTPTVLTTVLPTLSTVVSTVITEVVIPNPGEFTQTYYETIYPSNNPQLVTPPDPGPSVVTGTAVIKGTVEIVQTDGPVIVVVTVGPHQTEVVQAQVTTGVARFGGSEVTNVVVITPTLGTSEGMVTVVGGSPVTVVNTLGPVTATTVVDGVQRTVVETPPPQTIVRIDGGVTTTIMPGQLVTSTVVNTVGGTPVTRLVVTTPTGPPFEPITYTVVRDVGGTLVTEAITTTPTGAPGEVITLTEVDIVGGTPVTQLVVTTANGVGIQPVSYTVTTNVGGTPTVITVTPGPTTIVETIDGTAVTRVTTPPVTSFTTTVGGTPTTQVFVTTPTGTEPITITFVSTSGGTLSTFTSTFAPSTYVTTISGTLRTITSTPSPSTIISTVPLSTLTWTSTQSATNTANTRPTATVIPNTRVYRWTEADIFIGTFLPALLGVALIIPLRIIDLNAKLYQPYQALAKQHQQTKHNAVGSSSSSTGADTLLLQYTGLWGFITPVITLLQGHPVPFLTTLMVGCASLVVPLATEAVGLKLHGKCYLNTASAGCGPALGVSVAPARALVALLAVVVVVLVVVMVLVGRWATGLWANPWSLAGIASLARNEQVRIRREGEGGMRREVAGKVYGLGYFRNEGGREEYGIVLMDEEGMGLHRGGRDTESELMDDDEPGLMAKWGGGGSQQLPFMTLRYPWRISFVLLQVGVFIFVVYYHAYYRGGIRDNGRLWMFLNANTFGVRFVSAVVGVVIAFCWQAFFLSVSQMTPFYLLSVRTQPPDSSILYTPCTNPFSGIYSSVRRRQPFLLAVSLAAILSEFLPVILSNVPFNLAQTGTAATVCAVLACLFLGVMLAALAASFFVRYPPMPVDPRCVAGLLWYVSQSRMLENFEGVSRLGCGERELRVKEMGMRYFYGPLLSYGDGRRLGVECDGSGGGEDGMGYLGVRGVTRGRAEE